MPEKETTEIRYVGPYAEVNLEGGVVCRRNEWVMVPLELATKLFVTDGHTEIEARSPALVKARADKLEAERKAAEAKKAKPPAAGKKE